MPHDLRFANLRQLRRPLPAEFFGNALVRHIIARETRAAPTILGYFEYQFHVRNTVMGVTVPAFL